MRYINRNGNQQNRKQPITMAMRFVARCSRNSYFVFIPWMCLDLEFLFLYNRETLFLDALLVLSWSVLMNLVGPFSSGRFSCFWSSAELRILLFTLTSYKHGCFSSSVPSSVWLLHMTSGKIELFPSFVIFWEFSPWTFVSDRLRCTLYDVVHCFFDTGLICVALSDIFTWVTGVVLRSIWLFSSCSGQLSKSWSIFSLNFSFLSCIVFIRLRRMIKILKYKNSIKTAGITKDPIAEYTTYPSVSNKTHSNLFVSILNL